MLEARQQALREQAAQLAAQLGNLPANASATAGDTPKRASEHLQKAVETMQQFEKKLADARYEPSAAAEGAEMGNLADMAARRLADASQALQRGMASGEQQSPADKAQELAEQLAQDAEAYDQSLTDAEKAQMLARLEAARKLLESMAGVQWATMSSGGGPGSAHVYTKDPHTAPAEAARLLARQFWSVALEAQQRQSRRPEDEPSAAEFFEAENTFFEKAAQFKPQRVEK